MEWPNGYSVVTRPARACNLINRRLFIQSVLLAASTAPGCVRADRLSEFGTLERDPNGVLDLPKNFTYRIISRKGDEMDDGLLVPARADGMAAFAGPDGNIVLVCNHENHPGYAQNSPFGSEYERLGKIDSNLVYDMGAGKTPGTGGTTTIVYDPQSGKTLHRHLSLAGTEINCAGGPTPWGSWLSCEEAFSDPGIDLHSASLVHREKRHGYIFEVPAESTQPVKPTPLTEMGRFRHEAAAVNPASGIVYLSEDRHESLLYRYIPNVPGQLARGGQLQALAIVRRPSFDTRNWDNSQMMRSGDWLDTHWIDLADVDVDEDDLRFRGSNAGAAIFARGEGLCYADGSVFLTATFGGPERLGQVFEYRISNTDGKATESDSPGQIRLLVQSTAEGLLKNADNLTMGPWGDLIICEDTAERSGLIGLRPNGELYELADNRYTSSELAGACFSPDGSTLFVNIQDEGRTLAITGPWQKT
jgi:secreted PhoX family phosphatase